MLTGWNGYDCNHIECLLPTELRHTKFHQIIEFNLKSFTEMYLHISDLQTFIMKKGKVFVTHVDLVASSGAHPKTSSDASTVSIMLKITPKAKFNPLTFGPFKKCVNCAYVVPQQIQQQCLDSLLQTYASVTFLQTLIHLLIQRLGQVLDLPFLTLPTTESPPMGDFHRSGVTITEMHVC